MDQNLPADAKAHFAARWGLYGLSILIVLIGLLNSTPGIPGLDEGLQSLTGADWLTIRKFPTEWFYPIAFAMMMLCVALKHSMWASWSESSSGKRLFGLFMDVALVVAAIGISLTYLIEIESVCLIDQISGERARMMADSLARERELAELYGLPEPTTVEDPQCVATTGGLLVAIVGIAVLIFLAYNVKVWGLPLVMVALAIVLYTFTL